MGTLGEQVALMAKEDEVVAVEPVVPKIPTVNNDALLSVNGDADWEPEGAVSLDKVKLARARRKSRKL